jgi:hypothetical protein
MKFNITHNTVYLFDSEVFSRAALFEIPTKTNTVFDVTDFSIISCQNQQDIK